MAVVRCECGYRLPRPMPRRCPQCQAVLVGVRHQSIVSPFLVITLLLASLAGLVWFAIWWSNR